MLSNHAWWAFKETNYAVGYIRLQPQFSGINSSLNHENQEKLVAIDSFAHAWTFPIVSNGAYQDKPWMDLIPRPSAWDCNKFLQFLRARANWHSYSSWAWGLMTIFIVSKETMGWCMEWSVDDPVPLLPAYCACAVHSVRKVCTCI